MQSNLAQYLPQSQVSQVAVVPDEIDAIRHKITKWTEFRGDQQVDLVITSGGTGFAPRDVTPEAVRPLLDREATGMMAAMNAVSLSKTPFAALARPLAGIRNTSIVICLPGSPKAVNEILEQILPVIPHGISLLRGDGCSCGSAVCPHKKPQKQEAVETDSGCPHHHATSHVSSTHERPWARKSPYPMVDMEVATRTVIGNTPASLGVVRRPLSQVHGMVLAEDVHATEPFPPFEASIKDGYAVVAEDGPGVYSVIGGVMAGTAAAEDVQVSSGTVCKVMTGAPIPRGANAVIMVEDTEIIVSDDGGGDDNVERVKIVKQVKAGCDIRPIGSDIAQGELVLSRGTRLLASEIGLLASIGKWEVEVHRRVRVGLLSTGDELIDPNPSVQSSAPRYGQIYDSNRIAIISAIRISLGENCCDVIDLGIAADTQQDLRDKMLLNAFTEHDLDVLITSGGVSMGEYDLIKPLLESQGKVHFGRVMMKP